MRTTIDLRGWYFLTVDVTTPCGTSRSTKQFEIKSRSYCNSIAYQIYPNPASDELTIAFMDRGLNDPTVEKIGTSNFYIAEVELLDKFSQILLKTTISSEKTVLDISDIPEGVYFLHIKQGEKIVRERVMIMR